MTIRRWLPLSVLALGPLVFVLGRLGVGDVLLFLLSAAALVPLAWLIGKATEQVAHHTGAGIGGFLNATFGNAPELIVALVAVSQGLTDVVRASLTGSVVGNLLLVLGFSLLVGGRGTLDRTSVLMSVGQVGLVVLLLLVPSVPGLSGDPDRHSLAVLSLPVAVVLLAVRVVVNRRALRRFQRRQALAEPAVAAEGLSLRGALGLLGLTTIATVLVTETLVDSLEAFSARVNLSEFFVAAVVVAIVGNAAEHGSAIFVAARGRIELAAEIALASAAQVAALLIPAVAIVSWAIEPLALSFRPIELTTMAGAAALAALVLSDGRSSRPRGALLIAAYVGVSVAYYLAGNR